MRFGSGVEIRKAVIEKKRGGREEREERKGRGGKGVKEEEKEKRKGKRDMMREEIRADEQMNR